MSVLLNKRSESKAEFVNNAYNLALDAIDLTSRLSARYSRIFTEPIAKLTNELLSNVIKANAIRPVDKTRFNLRYENLLQAKQAVEALDVYLTLVYEILMKNPKAAFIKSKSKTDYDSGEWAKKKLNEIAFQLGTKVDKEIALIKGVIESDKKRFPEEK